MQFQNILPCKENPFASFEQFKNSVHRDPKNKGSLECDTMTPYFKIFSPVHIPITLNYTDVVLTLAHVVSLTYSKLMEIAKTDSKDANGLFPHIKDVDIQIQTKIIMPIVEDLKQVATRKTQ